MTNNGFPSIVNFVKFTCDMDEHIMTNATFFNKNLLNIIEKNFDYTNICFSIYEKGAFTSAITNNKLNYVVKDYLMNYNEKDAIAKGITNKLSKSKYSNPTEVILGTDIITSPTYELSDYAKFYSEIGLLYVAVCPINENFRFCVYKEKESGNFTTTEKEVMLNVSKIIISKYYIHLKLQEEYYLNKCKNLMLDKNLHGFIILNDTLQPIDYNDKAVEYLTALFDNKSLSKTNISRVCKSLLKLMEIVPDSENGIIKIINNFKITFSLHKKTDDYNFMTKYYYLYIKKMCSDHDKNNNSSLISTLSHRELEVVECLANGLSYNEISEKLFISLNTVRTHIKNIYKKLDIDNQRSLLQLFNFYKKINDT